MRATEIDTYIETITFEIRFCDRLERTVGAKDRRMTGTFAVVVVTVMVVVFLADRLWMPWRLPLLLLLFGPGDEMRRRICVNR